MRTMVNPDFSRQDDYEGQQMPMPTMSSDARMDEKFPYMWFVSSADALAEFEHNLRGEVPIIEGGDIVKWEQRGERLANDQGIRFLISFIQINTGKTTHLTYLSHDQIRQKMEVLHGKLINVIFARREEFDIKKEHRDVIILSTMNFIHNAYQRALLGGERDFLSDTMKQSISYNMTGDSHMGQQVMAPPPPQRRGIGRLFGRG